jgi:hypoxanthine phosphoribosyltransferase
MADASARLEILIGPEEVARRVEALAARLAPRLENGTVGVCLLLGGLWFAADLTRALARQGRDLDFDGLWLASYGDATRPGATCEVRAGLQRPVAGRDVLLMDDVADTGASLARAVEIVTAAGARRVATAVFARKPWSGRWLEPDHFAWEAPSRFLVGYGMDAAGALRGLPYVGALSEDASQDGSLSRPSISS